MLPKSSDMLNKNTLGVNKKRWPSDQANNIVAFLASADIKVFGRTYLPINNAASVWPHTFLYPGCFV